MVELTTITKTTASSAAGWGKLHGPIGHSLDGHSCIIASSHMHLSLLALQWLIYHA